MPPRNNQRVSSAINYICPLNCVISGVGRPPFFSGKAGEEFNFGDNGREPAPPPNADGSLLRGGILSFVQGTSLGSVVVCSRDGRISYIL